MMAFFKKRSFVFGATYYCAMSLAIILFSSPLFRVLGFEYSGFIALFASVHLLYYTSGFGEERRSEGIWNLIKAASLPVFFLSSLPLFVSIISALFIPNCSLWDGIIFYIEIVYPTALIAMLIGIRFGIIPRSRTKTNIYLAIFWITTMLISLLPGYFSAKIYTYGWQYGYFPGFVWDEAMELTKTYWVLRLNQFVLISVWLIFDSRVLLIGKYNRTNRKKIYETKQGRMILLAFLIVIFSISIFFPTSSDMVNQWKIIDVANGITVHYTQGNLTEDEISSIKARINNYVYDVRKMYNLKNEVNVSIYIYSSSDALFQEVGTREASISKPWKHSIYITKQNLHSLKHEIAHILLAEYGNFPFDISWSTGLTEGAAVAIEDDFDGIRSGDEMAARILQMKLANGVQGIMQFSGFASNASSVSYVLAGSFCRYLLTEYGGEKFVHVYRNQDYEDVYNKSISSLEKEWKNSLGPFETPMDHYDSLRTQYYFNHTSIIHEQCIRRIGKLLKNADEAYKSKNYSLADSLYTIAVNESGRINAIRGRVLCKIHLNDPVAALMILDTTPSANTSSNLPPLYILRGDMIALATGDFRRASAEWEEAMKIQLGDNYFEAAFMRRYFLCNTDDTEGAKNILQDMYGLIHIEDMQRIVYSITAKDNSDYQFYLARLFFYSAYIEKTGYLSKSASTWNEGFKRFEVHRAKSQSPETELFEKLAQKRFSYP
jgi:hypothetical protein